MHQTVKTYLEREHSILLSLPSLSQKGRCVKDGSSLSSLE